MSRGAPLLAAPRATLGIRKARLRNAVAGDRERMAQQLDQVRHSDIGLKPRSILLIPRVVVERPLVRRGGHDRFSGSVVDTLRSALRRARRPGDAHSAEDPLLFDDEADIAAGLIQSWLGGSAERGWWSSVTQGQDPPSWWRRQVIRDGFLLPRVVARLTNGGIVHAWIARLDAQDIETAIATLETTYGSRAASAAQIASSRTRRHVFSALAQLTSVVPEIVQPGVSTRARVLIAIALLAHRRPALIPTPMMQRALSALAEPTPVLPSNARLSRQVPAKSSQTSSRPMTPFAPPQTETEAAPRDAPRASGQASVTAVHDGDHMSPPTALASATAESTPALQISTAFGGLLFVLNAVIALELYGDFSRPRHGLTGFSPFALLALLGRNWFGRSFRQDPLHLLLLGLAGEDCQAAALASRRWSVPDFWLDPWSDERAIWTGCPPRRSMAWHPAGFPIVEFRGCDHRAPRLAARRAGVRRRRDKARMTRLPRDSASRWIACLDLYLRARLARTLERADPIALLCRQRATVDVDDDRLTARFNLADHPLAIRLAGLDRDPGWIPAGGRIVEFAFE